MSHAHADPSRPRRRFRPWLSRVWAAMRNRPYQPADLTTPLPPLDPRITVNRREEITFTTPARGDVYDFTMKVELCWCATGATTDDVLHAKINSRRSDMTAEIKTAARPVARRFAPYRPGDAEMPVTVAVTGAVESALAAVPDEDGVVVNCTPRVRVEMADAIRELQRPLVAAQVKLDGRYDLSALAAQRLGELRVIWRDFIADGLPEWETPYAISLAQQPDQAARELFAMRKDRRDEASTLVETVAHVATGHDRLDLLEFAVVSDSALRKTYELLGLPLPDPGPDSLFSGPGNGTTGDPTP